MRSFRAQNNAIAVSANTAETAINTPRDPDTLMQVAIGDVIQAEPRRENDVEELNGAEEATRIYDLGQTASGSLNFNKCQPQHVGFLGAYALGAIATSAAGAGYEHVITPIAEDWSIKRSNPSFTLAMQMGGVLKRRFASAFVDQLTLTFARDEWVKAVGQLKLTGKTEDNVTQETVSALNDVTELTLAANGVYGSTGDERLDSIHRVEAELTTGVWTEVEVTAVSDATPAVLTITSLAGDGLSSIDYRILYRPAESASWMTFPSLVTETPMRVSDVSVNFGGSWDGTDFTGGFSMTCEAKQIEWSFQNNLQIEFCFGEAGAYAGRAFRDGRVQTLRVDREFRDMIMQQHISGNDTFGIKILAEGAEFDTGHNYTVELIFPKVGILNAPLSVDGKRNSEAAELTVMEHATHGSVRLRVKNAVSTYAASS